MKIKTIHLTSVVLRFTFLVFLLTSLVNAQEINKKQTLVGKQTKITNSQTATIPNAPQATGDTVTVKDDAGNVLMTVTDEGSAGSIKLKDAGAVTPSANKLYNNGGSLYWNGSALGSGATEINDLSDGKTTSTSTYLGSGSGTNSTGSLNTAVGYQSLSPSSSSSGNENIAIGASALSANTSGDYNTAVGQATLKKNTTGNNNTALGEDALYNNISGSGNVALGMEAGRNETGSNKLYINNDSSSSPLIWGDFANDIATINGKLGVGTMNPSDKVTIVAAATGEVGLRVKIGGGTKFKVEENGGVAIGSNYGATPANGLYVHAKTQTANLQVTTGATDGYVLTSDATGNATWQAGSGSDNDWTVSGTNMSSTPTGNVGIGTSNPLSKLSVGSDGSPSAAISGNASAWGVYGVATSSTGRGVYGSASDNNNVINYGGYFLSSGNQGQGVRGIANGNLGRGVYGTSAGNEGRGIMGNASSNGNVTNYGGYFTAEGEKGKGVYGYAPNTTAQNYGGHFEAAGASGRGVYGYASNDGAVTNFGGRFVADGESGRGVNGYASNNGAVTNFGGRFVADGENGRGVFGHASNNSESTKYGGYFTANGIDGIAVYGKTTLTGPGSNTAGYFEANGDFGKGVIGKAPAESTGTNTGGHFEAGSTNGIGVYAETTSSLNGASGTAGYFLTRSPLGTAVRGHADDNTAAAGNYGGKFSANGISGIGVYGIANIPGTNGKGVVGNGRLYDFDAIGVGINYGATSSIRWKRNIVEIDKPLEKLAQIRGVYFDWDEEHGSTHDVGCIAEEIGKVLPEIVAYEGNGIDADGMDYSKLTPLLIEVAKEQQKLIEKLSIRIQDLEKRVRK